MVFIETDPFGDDIELTDERWQHITTRHPELAGHLDDMQATIREPNVVYRNQTDPTQYDFYKLVDTQFGQMYLLAVVIKTDSPFIVTARLTRTLRPGGDLAWLRR